MNPTTPSTEAVKLAATAVHTFLSRRDVMQYLDNPEDCEGIARAVLESLRSPSPINVMAEALNWYADQLCEGWCEQSPDCAHFDDCAGCLARRTVFEATACPAIAKARGNPEQGGER